MENTREIRIDMKVRNNLVLSAMEQRGIATVAELRRRMGLPLSDLNRLGNLINMKK